MNMMTYKQKRAMRRSRMKPQFADVIEGFALGSVFLYLVTGFAYWWVTGEVLIRW